MNDLEAMKEMMEGLLKPLNEKIETLTKTQETLTAENESLKIQLRQNMDLAHEGASAPQNNGALGDPRAARHVTIVTRPVQDDPSNPYWGDKIADTGLLVKNSLSGGMKE